MPNMKDKPEAKQQSSIDFDDAEGQQSQEELESLCIAASEALAEAEEDYAEAQQETAEAKIDVAARDNDLKEARNLYRDSPSDDTRYQYFQGRSAKEKADERLDDATQVEEQCKVSYENAMKAAIVAEIRRDYSELKPQTDALQQLEAKHEKLSSEIDQLKQTREESKENNKRTGYLDKQISVKEEKLAALQQKIADKKEQISNTVDAILDKCETSASQRIQQKAESKTQSEPKPEQSNQPLIRQHPSKQELQKYEANLRGQLNKVEVEKGMLKKVLGNMSPYAKAHEVRNLQRAIERLEKNTTHLKHEIGHVQKVLKGEIQHPVVSSHHKHHMQNTKNQEDHQPTVDKPKQAKMARTTASTRSTASKRQAQEELSPDSRSAKMDRFIEMGPELEKEHMDKVKSGEDIEKNLGDGAEVVAMVIELAVTRNLAIKQGWDINKQAPEQPYLLRDEESVTPKYKTDLDIRETRSMHSEVAYGVAKRKSTGTTTSSSTDGAVAPAMPVLPTSTKLK